jgi:CheY-like chemotaxis protein
VLEAVFPVKRYVRWESSIGGNPFSKPQQHRRYYMNQFTRQFALLILLGVFLSSWGNAQDPFENEGDNDQAVETPLPLDGSASPSFALNERSAVVQSLRASPPKSPAELARAVHLMSRIRRWDEVRHWLDQVAKLTMNEATAVQMVQTTGSQTWMRLLGAEAELTDAQRALARKILDLTNASNTNPKKLNAYLLRLRSEVKAERVQAFRSLQSAGNFGIAALLNHLLSEQAAAPTPAMCETFSLMGKQAQPAWLAAMLTPDASARGRLAQLVVRDTDPTMVTSLCTVAVDDRVPQEVRTELAAIATQKNKLIPTATAVHRHALEQMQKSLHDYQQTRSFDEADAFLIWQLSNDGRSIAQRSGQISDMHWQRAVQFANCVLLTGGAADIDSAMALAVLSEQSALMNPDSASVESAGSILPALMRDSFEFACLIWDAADKANLPTAQVLAVRNMARWAEPETFPNPVRERLALACRSGHAAVRYEAAAALLSAMVVTRDDGTVQINELHFEGRNRLEKILAEMRRLEARPLALIVGGNSELRTHTRGLLEAYSFRVAEAASAQQTMEELRSGQPVEAIVIVEHVLEMDLGQLVQRIRAFPSTASCPIAVLAESLSRGEHSVAGNDPRVVMGSVPPEQAGFADILRRMRVVAMSPMIDPANRIAWNDLANGYWNQLQTQYVSANPKSEFQPSIETPAGQLRLIEIVKDSSKSMPQREQASQIFVQSVKQFGLLISTETANAQYDEYNKRGPTEPELLVVLGRVLDAMEAGNGKRAWSEVAP